MAVSKSTVVENIFKEFYDLLIAISNFDIYPAFPNKKIENKSTYPVMILDSPDISWANLTFSQGLVKGTIDLEIYTASAPTCDQYASDATNKIESSESVLYAAGLEEVRLDSTTKTIYQRGDINVHVKTLTWRFEYNFSRT